jgi:hypothetical protein
MTAVSKDQLISKLRDLKTIAEECLALLVAESDACPTQRSVAVAVMKRQTLDFSKPIRPFMKSHSNSLTGSKKFVLLLACLAKGDLKRQVALSEIKKKWSQMTGILKMDFNLFFTGDARDRDWVETKSKGLYNLRPSWRDIFEKSK